MINAVKSEYCIPLMPLMISIPPTNAMTTKLPYIHKFIIGLPNAINFSAPICSFLTSEEVSINFSVSCCSLTKDFTTRILIRFSCTSLFIASNFDNIALNFGNADIIIIIIATNRIGIATR